MSPFALRLLISASLLAPELRHAMLTALACKLLVETDGPRAMRASFVRSGRVNEVHETGKKIGQKVVFVCRDDISQTVERHPRAETCIR
jgi:hypothetical protein